MAINLNKNRDALVAAWKEVLNEKTDTNWALFGYEGQSNDLKVVSTGSGGIEELTEDLNSGKIMYAFVKINDPKTSLDKCVLINWQGDGANTVRKGMCANHLRDVEKLFVGANLTINARNEEEVEPELIIDKIAKSGSAYSFKAPRIENVEPSKPVGTAYQRVNPTKEINSQERDRFWRKEEQEEKTRVEEERKRRDEEQSRINEESKVREARETAKREADESLRNNNIDELKNAEKEKPVAAQIPIPVEETPKVNQSEVLRKQRNQEAQELISQRTIDARSIFEKNTSAGQVKKTPEKPVRASILKAQAMAQSETDQNNGLHKIVDATPQVKPQEEPSDEEGDQFSTIKRCPKGTDRNSVTSPTSPQEEVAPSTIITEQTVVKEETVKEETVRQITEQQFVDEYIYGITNPGLKARALYDYQAADDSEITFDPGDIITNIDQVDEGWWQGLAPDGTYGLFPANYVELLQ